MKVVHVIGSLAAGGAERSVLELVTELHRQGVDVQLVVLRSVAQGFEHDALSAGVPTSFLPHMSTPSKAAALRRLLRQQRPDVVHATLPRAVVLAGVASTGLGIVLVSSLVTAIPRHVLRQMLMGRGWRGRVWSWLYRAVCWWRVDCFHAVSASTAEVESQHVTVSGRRIRVVERGRDLGRLGCPSPERRRRVREALSIAPTTKLVVVGARLSTQKNLTALISSFAKVVERVPDAVLLIAGRDDDDAEAVRSAAAPLVAAGSVHLLGHRDDLPDLLAAADATALSSIIEGGAGVLIEAMALRVPIVSARIDGLASVLVHGDNALVAPQGDIDAFADALVSVLSDTELAGRLSAAGHRMFEERFTIEGAATRMVDLYRDAIDHSRSLRRWVRRSERQN